MRLFPACLALCVLAGVLAESPAADPLDIGSRRELLVDGFLIDRLSGDAVQKVQQPEPREVALVTDRPWEGNTCAYYTIFQDGELFRMYYRGSHWDTAAKRATHREVTCYAESRDGIHWTRPNLGLFEFEGSKENNIVWDGIGTHCFTPFRDENPDAPPEARYKAISSGVPGGKKGLYVFQSADAIHWSLLHDEPVITEGAFDSQNLAFWDPHAGLYRCYHRDFRKVRDIKTETSADFLNWTQPRFLDYGETPLEHLYTNAIRNAPGAPHLLIGFPTRFLPDQGQRVEPTFLSSRDGITFHRWLEPVVPESAPEERSGNRSNYMAWGVLTLPSEPGRYSVYATEAYYEGPDSRIRRFSYRADGYVAIESGKTGGELLTKPLQFDGARLRLNAIARDGGHLNVQIEDEQGRPVPGYTFADAVPFVGDSLSESVAWKSGGDVSGLSGKSVRLRIAMKDAKLFAFQFE